MKALITARFDKSYLPRLEALGYVCEFAGYGVTGYTLSQDELADKLEGVNLFIGEFQNVSREVMEKSPKLSVILCCRNEAFASVDIRAASELGIAVIRAGGRNCVAVAEHAMALLMCVSKNISLTDHLLKHTDELTTNNYFDKQGGRKGIISEWSTDPRAPFAVYGGGPEMFEKTFGQIGFGAIGRQVAVRAKAFGMNVWVYDPFVDAEQIEKDGYKKVELDELMSGADFISVNCNVTDQTRGLISRERIAMMKKTAYIVNTARAPIVDYDALYDALKEKRIAGAGLDVYPVEPIPAGFKFFELTNVVLTPHLAGSSRDIIKHQTDTTVSNLEELLAGKTPRYLCNPEALKSLRALK